MTDIFEPSIDKTPLAERKAKHKLALLLDWLARPNWSFAGGLHSSPWNPSTALQNFVYPSSGQSIRLHYRLLGKPVTVATVNLTAEWPDIHDELVAMIERPDGQLSRKTVL